MIVAEAEAKRQVEDLCSPQDPEAKPSTNLLLQRKYMHSPVPVLSIIGKSGVGKTTILEKLIPELKSRGLKIATIKHHAHPGFDIDQPGKDTWRHAQAGSDLVIIAAPDKIATIQKLEQEKSLDEIFASIDGDILS